MRLYATGKYSIADIGRILGYSDGTIYKVLKNADCEFNHKWKHPVSDEVRAKLSLANKGKKISEAQRKAISEHNSCNYNGFNGYGHTKKHRSGYVMAYAPKHPNATTDGYVMLHRILAERTIGRYLEPSEVVHHVNHIRDDNRIENLRIMGRSEHMSMHMKERHEKRRNDLSIDS